MEKAFPAIWVKFTPYLIDWAIGTFGTAVEVSGRAVVELRKLAGVKHALREAVSEDLVMTDEISNSLSQLRYDVCLAERQLCTDSVGSQPATQIDLRDFLPVHVPEFLLQDNGVVRRFSRLMYMRRHAASFIASQVYHAFWAAVHRFAQDGNFALDHDMLESFCEEQEIPSLHLDDLRNQYQRLKRRKYFLKES